MAFARLSALGSLAAAIVFAVLVPNADGVGLAVLVGWLGVLALALGLVLGEPTALVVAAVAFMVRIAMVSVAVGGLLPPLWAQVLLLVVIFELAALSMETRTRAMPPWRAARHVLTSGLAASIVSLTVESAVYGSAPGGFLLRVSAVGAAIILVGWIVTRWVRATG